MDVGLYTGFIKQYFLTSRRNTAGFRLA